MEWKQTRKEGGGRGVEVAMSTRQESAHLTLTFGSFNSRGYIMVPDAIHNTVKINAYKPGTRFLRINAKSRLLEKLRKGNLHPPDAGLSNT